MSVAELLSTALLGTERRQLTAAAPLEVQRDTPEEQLLAAAAATVVYRRAGMRPRGDLRVVDPAPPETLPLCSHGAALRLSTILAGEAPGVLDEWLMLARARGVRAPEELLPALLVAGRDRQEAVLAVAGERGRWLGRIDERWAWAGGADDAWEVGTLDARRRWLRERRVSDSGAGRAALEESWATEDPRSRGALLEVLAVGLSRDDEAFLETALDDRRQEVRIAASHLLSRIPESRFAERMTERALPLLRLGRGVRSRIEAELPEELDADATRDLVLVKPPRGTGERAWWLRQVVAATQLSVWERALGRAPAELVRLPVANNLAAAVHGGWSEAAARQLDPAWAAALLPQTWEADLVAAVQQEVAEEQIRTALDDARVYAVLQALRRPWGLELSRAIVGRGHLDRATALALDPRVLDELPDDAPPGVVQLLAFRHDLHKELT